MQDDFIKTVEQRIAELERQLADDPRYREITILRQTLENLRALPGVRVRHREILPTEAKVIPASERPVAALAVDLLRQAGRPLTTRQLLERLTGIGRRIGGTDQAMNLSSILSKSNLVRSVEWDGARGWWPRDIEIPPSSLSEGREADAATSAPKH